MSHTYSNLLIHVVFSTKNRQPFVDANLKRELWPYIGGVLRGQGCTPIIVNGMADHVHFLTTIPTTLAVADLVRDVKSNSSGWVHKKWKSRREFGWQTGFGAFSVSESNRKRVVQYIEGQGEHHKKRSFQEEFLALLKRHGIDYDPKHVWD